MGSVSNPSGSVLGVLPSIQFDHVHLSAHMGVVVEAVVVLIVDSVSVDVGVNVTVVGDVPVVGVLVDVIVDGVSVDVYVTVTVVGDVPVDIGFDDPVVGVAVDVIVDGVSVDVYVTVTDVGVGVTVVVEVVDVSVL